MRKIIDSWLFKVVGGLLSVAFMVAFVRSLGAATGGPEWGLLVAPAFYATGLAGPYAKRWAPIEILVIAMAGTALTALVLGAVLLITIRGGWDIGLASMFLIAVLFSVCLTWFGWWGWLSARRGH